MPTRSKYSVLSDADFDLLMERNLRLLEERLFMAEWDVEMNESLGPSEAIAKLRERVDEHETALLYMRVKKKQWDSEKPK